MKQRLLHTIFIIIILTGSVQSLFAQKAKFDKANGKDWFVGVNGGVNLFYGDIKFNVFLPAPKFHEIQAGAGFVFGKKLSTAFKLSSELNLSSLKGSRAVLPDTLEFNTRALSFAFKGHLDPFAFVSGKEGKFAFYIESGVGIMAWKSLLQNQSTQDTLNNLGWTNPNKEFSFFIPAGIQLEYQIVPRLSTYLKSSYNIVFSDLLDGYAFAGFDGFTYTSLGINYYFGKQKAAPKLLPYNYFEIEYDSINQSIKQEPKIEEIKTVEEQNNPFSFTLNVPEEAPHTGFDIHIYLSKTGVSSTGFFRLVVPSGFIPQPTSNDDVVFTKLAYLYEYDFILPMNQDSTVIPIHIKLSEIEKGTYPILIEGEIRDSKGSVFPIKLAAYTKIISEEAWQKGLSVKEEKQKDIKNTEVISDNVNKPDTTAPIAKKEELEALPKAVDTIALEKKKESSEGVYRIQIMASKEAYADLDNFKTKHKITENIYVAQGDGWYRYNLYESTDKKEANRLCAKVQSEHEIPQAFVTYYENGKRVLAPASSPGSKSSTISKTSTTPKTNVTQKPTVSTQIKLVEKPEVKPPKSGPIYRIEIAVVHDKPMALNILQAKVGKEKISEFNIDLTYYYTIGEFDDLAVARAFLNYVKSQLKIESAQIGEYLNDKRIKGVF